MKIEKSAYLLLFFTFGMGFFSGVLVAFSYGVYLAIK
mgnify:CR=1 FL=1|jgi:hypothetical protein|tara:strand:+ start:2449 stop:2559 length:111 start_codon:yes stop_codon:yes gene_type:complete